MDDYTEIRDVRIRTKICVLMSAMLDNPDEYGIYPTSEFMWKMETFVLDELEQPQAELKQLAEVIHLQMKQNQAQAEEIDQNKADMDKYLNQAVDMQAEIKRLKTELWHYKSGKVYDPD